MSIVNSFEKLWPNAFTSSVPVVPQTVHLYVLEPELVLLDEVDSGVDVDNLNSRTNEPFSIVEEE